MKIVKTSRGAYVDNDLSISELAPLPKSAARSEPRPHYFGARKVMFAVNCHPDIVFDKGALLKEVTPIVRVKERPITKFRFRLGLRIIRFAVWVMGTGIEIEA